MCVVLLASVVYEAATGVNELQLESPLTRALLIRQGLRDRLSFAVLTSASG